MPPFVLTILKGSLLALLYFFIYRAVRAVVADLYGRRGRQRAPGPPKAKPARRGKGTPRELVLLDQRGRKVSVHRLDGTLQIGKADSCDIRPDDTYVSQAHARVSRRGDAWVVEDLGSTNGTYLNRRKVTVPTEIAPGDRIRVGKTEMEVRK